MPLIYLNYNLKIFFISLLFVNLRGMLKHDNRCIWLIGYYILHHKYPNYNYGEYWLDYIFKTNYAKNNEYIKGIIYM